MFYHTARARESRCPGHSGHCPASPLFEPSGLREARGSLNQFHTCRAFYQPESLKEIHYIQQTTTICFSSLPCQTGSMKCLSKRTKPNWFWCDERVVLRHCHCRLVRQRLGRSLRRASPPQGQLVALTVGDVSSHSAAELAVMLDKWDEVQWSVTPDGRSPHHTKRGEAAA